MQHINYTSSTLTSQALSSKNSIKEENSPNSHDRPSFNQALSLDKAAVDIV